MGSAVEAHPSPRRGPSPSAGLTRPTRSSSADLGSSAAETRTRAELPAPRVVHSHKTRALGAPRFRAGAGAGRRGAAHTSSPERSSGSRGESAAAEAGGRYRGPAAAAAGSRREGAGARVTRARAERQAGGVPGEQEARRRRRYNPNLDVASAAAAAPTPSGSRLGRGGAPGPSPRRSLGPERGGRRKGRAARRSLGRSLVRSFVAWGRRGSRCRARSGGGGPGRCRTSPRVLSVAVPPRLDEHHSRPEALRPSAVPTPSPAAAPGGSPSPPSCPRTAPPPRAQPHVRGEKGWPPPPTARASRHSPAPGPQALPLTSSSVAAYSRPIPASSTTSSPRTGAPTLRVPTLQLRLSVGP